MILEARLKSVKGENCKIEAALKLSDDPNLAEVVEKVVVAAATVKILRMF